MNQTSKILAFSRAQLRCITKRSYTDSPGTVASSTPKNVSEPNVPGLSENVLRVPSSAVGPGASKTSNYKNPEYFSYDKNSYFEAEIEMLKYRLPQPSSLKN